jgi:hypothetical protein
MLRVVSIVACILCARVTYADYSFINRQDELYALTSRLIAYTETLQRYSSERMEYFARGLGWINDSSYGFYHHDLALFFTEDAIGFDRYDNLGRKIDGIVISADDKLLWASYRSYIDPTEVTVGYAPPEMRPRLPGKYRTDEITVARWVLSDGSKYESWDRSIKVTRPDQLHWYAVYDVRDEGLLEFSQATINAMFRTVPYGNLSDEIFADVHSDVPYSYTMRILADARSRAMDLHDPDEVGRYAANWFRRLLQLQMVTSHELLFGAAQIHLSYLHRNRVSELLIADKSTPMNDFLVLHDETVGRPGFTGASAADRGEATGYGRNIGETVNVSRGEAITEVANWFHTVYHRRPYLIPEALHFAHARSGYGPGSIAVANWGFESQSIAGVDGVLYPVDGERYVPYAWSGVEAPDPFPGNTTGVGPVLSWYSEVVPEDAHIILTKSDGTPIPLLLTEVYYDPKFLEATPVAPLEPDTKYQLEVRSGNLRIAVSTFTTAPINPGEVVATDLIQLLPTMPAVTFYNSDGAQARALNDRKGVLTNGSGADKGRLFDDKYNFSFVVPVGWEPADRDWQEVHLVRAWRSIHLYLYTAGTSPNVQEIRSLLEPQLNLKPVSDKPVSAVSFPGIRVEYAWEYDAKAITYYLAVGNYALAVYGYGVEDDEIDSIVRTLEFSTLATDF